MPEWPRLFTAARWGRPLLILAALVVLIVLARRFKLLGLSRFIPCPGTLFDGICVTGLTGLTAVALWYSVTSGFYDFAEPTIPSVAWMFSLNHQLYPALDAPERYAQP
jgi:hypothetical protein